MVLLDTHTWVWSLTVDPKLPASCRELIEQTKIRAVSPTSFYEIAQKVRLGKWPIMEKHVGDLPGISTRQGMITIRITAEIAVIAGLMDWSHRDPFDRMIAATALVTGADLLSADTAFDNVPGLRRIWD